MDCIFCKVAAGEVPAEKIYEDEHVVAFRDINPVAPTHILLIPRKHIAGVSDLQAEDADLAGHLLLTAGKLAAELGVSEEGYRLNINTNAGAGQTVYHLHVHLLAGRKFTWPPG
jgi:histidine triad (HIT) family protein